MVKKIIYELTEKANEYLNKNRPTISNFIKKLRFDGIIESFEKIDDYNYKITFRR